VENVIPSQSSDLRTSNLTFISKKYFSNETEIVPQVGYFIKIPVTWKGHGCEHACKAMKTNGKDSDSDSCYVEQKYDGQRMQIHVNLALPLDNQVKLFSKDGHDSTKRRDEIIPYVSLLPTYTRTIRKALGIGTEDQRWKERCILDGELILWDDEAQRMQECTKLDDYLRVKVRYLSEIPNSSVANSNLHLMVVFFDLLVLDKQNLVYEPYIERTNLLSQIIHITENRVPHDQR
jgi:DNA ligase-4